MYLQTKSDFQSFCKKQLTEVSGKVDTIAVGAGSLLIKFIQNVFQGVFLIRSCTIFPCVYVEGS